jgi:elongator complex protein 3
MKYIDKIIKNSIGNLKNERDLLKVIKKICSKNSKPFPSKIELLKHYHSLVKKGKIKPDKLLEVILIKKQIRTISGVAPIAIFTKPYRCPGNCYFCPTQKDIPKSYLDNEPAVMRAIRNDYHPIKQVWDRLEALKLEGHSIDKLELIIMGGSFSNYPESYKNEFIKKVYWAANNYQKGISKLKIKDFDNSLSLEQIQKDNQSAKFRIIGLSVETRPDLISRDEIRLWRKLGVTRVELGVQILDKKILAKNNRGHGVKVIAETTRLLKDNGFKVIYHLMPGLPGSDSNKDIESFKKVFNNNRYKPDQIKIYPCVVTKGAKIYDWYKNGKFKPYSSNQLKKLLIKIKLMTPFWVRIIRVIRDIPSQSIEAGNKINNLRQIVNQEMAKKNLSCNCIRCREIKGNRKDQKLKLFKISYKASGGREIFLSIENKEKSNLYGILRLRLPDKNNKAIFDCLKGSALIRELHVYGPSLEINKRDKVKSQHQGIGKQLMEEAEKIVKRKNNFSSISVISGVGVRGYYQKLGYKLKDSYMVKKLDSN